MNKSKIEWCDSTWNPVTGCLHNCEYCYARKIANRFKGCDDATTYGVHCQATWKRVNPESSLDTAMFEVNAKCPPVNIKFNPKKQVNEVRVAPYPWGFQPTLRRDRYDEYSRKSARTIFVCSMADLFGAWIPDEWIEEVFTACDKAPQHRYLFLTKNPFRYEELHQKGILRKSDNMWYGYSATNNGYDLWFDNQYNCFASIEPLLGEVEITDTHWVIIGAETGNRNNKVVPQKEWIESICRTADEMNVPVFMKNSLIPVVGEENMRREFPWG